MDMGVQVSNELEQERKRPWPIVPGFARVAEKPRKTTVRMSHFRPEILFREHLNAKRECSSLDRVLKWENIGWCIICPYSFA